MDNLITLRYIYIWNLPEIRINMEHVFIVRHMHDHIHARGKRKARNNAYERWSLFSLCLPVYLSFSHSLYILPSLSLSLSLCLALWCSPWGFWLFLSKFCLFQLFMFALSLLFPPFPLSRSFSFSQS